MPHLKTKINYNTSGAVLSHVLISLQHCIISFDKNWLEGTVQVSYFRQITMAFVNLDCNQLNSLPVGRLLSNGPLDIAVHLLHANVITPYFLPFHPDQRSVEARISVLGTGREGTRQDLQY